MPEVIYQVEDPGKHQTQQKASRQGKIECCILAAIINITGQVPERQMSSAEPHEQQSQEQQHRPKDNQQLSKFAHDFSLSAGLPDTR
jgi:hypothetical protein